MTDLLLEEQITKSTYNRAAAAWVNENNRKLFWEAEMVCFQQLLPTGSVLEIGSGGGRDARELASLGYRYTGTDISAGLLDIARKTLPGHGFYQQSVYELDFPDKTEFDGFWAAASLLHVPKQRIGEALRRIKTVVKAGGIGFISLKDGDVERMETHELGGVSLNRFFAYWHKAEFSQVLERNGYEIVHYFDRLALEQGVNWHCFFVKLKNKE